MKNKKNEDTFIDLTPEIYMQITGDKQKEISNLKNNKTKILNEIKEYLRVLKALKEQKKQIKQQIKVNKKKLRASRLKKFKVNRELNQQIELVSSINKIFVEDEVSQIELATYYPENVKKIGSRSKTQNNG